MTDRQPLSGKSDEVNGLREKWLKSNDEIVGTSLVGSKKVQSNGDKCFKCGCCKKAFFGIKGLKRHNDKNHEGKKMTFDCGKCAKAFSKAKDLAAHVRTHEDSTLMSELKCGTCGKEFKSSKKLHVHVARKHSDTTEPFCCKVCWRGFEEADDLRKHSWTHCTEKNYACTLCKMTFAEPTILAVHTYNSHSDVPYGCSDCGKKFNGVRALTKHCALHIKNKSLNCSECNRTFQRADHLSRHARTHEKQRDMETSSGNPRKPQKLKSEENVTEVLVSQNSPAMGIPSEGDLPKEGDLPEGSMIVDSDEDGQYSVGKPYECGLCSEHFLYTQDLVKHIKNHASYEVEKEPVGFPEKLVIRTSGKKKVKAKIKDTSPVVSEKEASSKLDNECDYCSTRFKSAAHLTRHIRIHTGEKPFSCNVCSKRFSRKDKMLSHIRTHTASAQPEHPCPHCDKKYSRPSKLKIHIKTRHPDTSQEGSSEVNDVC